MATVIVNAIAIFIILIMEVVNMYWNRKARKAQNMYHIAIEMFMTTTENRLYVLENHNLI